MKITEKPKTPESNLAVIGIYMYDPSVFDICRTLKPAKGKAAAKSTSEDDKPKRGRKPKAATESAKVKKAEVVDEEDLSAEIEEEVEADAVQNAGETKEKLSGMKLEGERIDEEKNVIQEEGDKQIIDEIKKSGKKLPKEEHEKIGNMQKELFESTKQINETMANLGPLLKQAQGIKKQFMELGLVK